MKCLRPIKKDGDLLPCGRCEACLSNKTNEYIIRFLATQEKMCAYFCTLTYNDEHIPRKGVYKPDIQLFLARLKHELKKRDIMCKYVVISEYGGRKCRPHYHMNLFTSELVPILPLLENIWLQGIVHARFVDDKSLNYVAKYHSTKMLSENIYKLRDYSIFFRVDDETSLEYAKKDLYNRFGLSADKWDTFPIIPCEPPFRISSRGIGEELMFTDTFEYNIRNNKFYTINNNNQKSSLPRYYVDKLPLNAQIARRLAQFEYCRKRPSNKIDELAVKLNDYKRSLEHFSKEWAKNYSENVVIRKKHAQANID